MSAVSRLLGVALLATGLSGCVTYPYSYYAPNDAYGGGGYYYGERYDDGYGGGYGYVEPYASGYSTGWPVYYSTLWPVYRSYYDPFWSPGFYYGVTWFPSTYFGIGIGGWDAWPYYTPYSPYRYSFWDSYYAWYDPWYHHHWYRDRDWDDHGRDYDGWRDRNPGHGPRFGSARNEAERLARISGQTPAQAAPYGNARASVGSNWRGAPPRGSLSETGNLGKAPLSNADLYGGGRFAGRPGAVPRAGDPALDYRDDARNAYAPAAPAGGARGEGQRMGAGDPAARGGDPYAASRGTVQAPANDNAGWVGPAPRSRPTGYPNGRPYNDNSSLGAESTPRRDYSRGLPPQEYEPIEGSVGGSSRWRAAPSNPSLATQPPAWNRPAQPQRGGVPGNGGYDPRARQSMPQADYQERDASSQGRFRSRSPGYAASPQQRYEAPPQRYEEPPQRYEAPPQRYEAPEPQPRFEPAPEREPSRSFDRSDDDGGGSDSSRFDRGGRGGGNRERED